MTYRFQAPSNSIHFCPEMNSPPVMTITRDRIIVAEGVQLDDAARVLIEALEQHVRGMILAEREACAEICDHEMDQAINDQMMIAAGNCADKIRARGD